MSTFRFDLVDIDQIRLLGQIPAGRRIQMMLDARELAVGMIRGRLRRQHPDLSLRELNLKVLEEIGRLHQIRPGPWYLGVDPKSNVDFDVQAAALGKDVVEP